MSEGFDALERLFKWCHHVPKQLTRHHGRGHVVSSPRSPSCHGHHCCRCAVLTRLRGHQHPTSLRRAHLVAAAPAGMPPVAAAPAPVPLRVPLVAVALRRALPSRGVSPSFLCRSVAGPGVSRCRSRLKSISRCRGSSPSVCRSRDNGPSAPHHHIVAGAPD